MDFRFVGSVGFGFGGIRVFNMFRLLGSGLGSSFRQQGACFFCGCFFFGGAENRQFFLIFAHVAAARFFLHTAGKQFDFALQFVLHFLIVQLHLGLRTLWQHVGAGRLLLRGVFRFDISGLLIVLVPVEIGKLQQPFTLFARTPPQEHGDAGQQQNQQKN